MTRRDDISPINVNWSLFVGLNAVLGPVSVLLLSTGPIPILVYFFTILVPNM